MKKLILFLFLILYALPSYAELRSVAISCKAIIKEDNIGSRIITGFKYSLHTGIESEEVKNVTLKELFPKIEEVAWSGSAIYVFIFSDYTLNTKTLKSIINGIEKNPHMQIIYVGNGEANKWAEQIKKNYNL